MKSWEAISRGEAVRRFESNQEVGGRYFCTGMPSIGQVIDEEVWTVEEKDFVYSANGISTCFFKPVEDHRESEFSPVLIIDDSEDYSLVELVDEFPDMFRGVIDPWSDV